MKKILSFLLLLPIYFYRNCISPFTPPSCRFTPTCSEYAVQAIKKHGPFNAVCSGVIRGAVRDTTRFPNCFNSLPPLSLKMYFDIHTHHLSACPSEAIYNADSKYMPTPDEAIYISVGIHPWHLTGEDYPGRLQWVESMLQNDKRIIALGEAGLDKCCDTPSALQEEAFRKVISPR